MQKRVCTHLKVQSGKEIEGLGDKEAIHDRH